jgi:hypothetical protein
MTPPSFDITIALMNHKTQRLTRADVVLFRETFGDDPRIKLAIVETGIMPSAREDYRFNPDKVARCGTPAEYFFIAHDGRVALCCSDQDVMHPIGNTNSETIEQIWYKMENQIKFRNIALGIPSCPEICTKHCHLKEPS